MIRPMDTWEVPSVLAPLMTPMHPAAEPAEPAPEPTLLRLPDRERATLPPQRPWRRRLWQSRRRRGRA